MSENKVNVLNNVFSRRTFRQLIEENKSKVYSSAIRRYVDDPIGKSNCELIGAMYKKMHKSYRNEYFYKNTLLNKLLLGVHSIKTTTALTEIATAKSKADFVLINGKAVVYEIKTELDNLDRLENQVKDYYKVFDHVAVVTYESNLEIVKNKLVEMELPIGIYVLRKNGCLGTIKSPKEYKNMLNFDCIFKILRKYEYEELVYELCGMLPITSQFKYYTECKKMVSENDIETVYNTVLKILKRRTKIQNSFFDEIPYELKFLAYFMNLEEKDYVKANKFLKTEFGGV